MKRLALLSASVLVFAACGGMTPEQRLVGKWEAEMFGEKLDIEFYDDGTVMAEDDDLQNWAIEDDGGDLVLLVWDAGHGSRDDAIELELTFDGNDRATLSAEGMTATMERVR